MSTTEGAGKKRTSAEERNMDMMKTKPKDDDNGDMDMDAMFNHGTPPDEA